MSKETWEEQWEKEIIYRSGKENGRWNCMSLDEERVIKSFISNAIDEAVLEERRRLSEDVKYHSDLNPDHKESLIALINKDK